MYINPEKKNTTLDNIVCFIRFPKFERAYTSSFLNMSFSGIVDSPLKVYGNHLSHGIKLPENKL